MIWGGTKITSSLREFRVIGSQLYLLIFHANFLFQKVNRLLLRNSWNHYVLSDRPCTFPLTIKNHSKNKPSIENYQQGLLLQITTKLLQITSALLIINCGRYYQEPCHYVSWYYKLRQNYYKLRPAIALQFTTEQKVIFLKASCTFC